MKKVRIALVGVGRWGKNLLKEFSLQAEIVAVCHTGKKETEKFLFENYPTLASTVDYNNLLDDPSIEAIAIATPTDTHFELAQQALRAGKHVFLEKPGSTRKEDLEILATEAEQRQLTLAIGYEFPHHPAAQKIKELLSDAKLMRIDFEWLKWGTFKDNAVPHLLSHEISLMKYWGLHTLTLEEAGIEKIISATDCITIRFRDKEVVISCRINRASPLKAKIVTITTNKGTFIWNNNELGKINIEQEALEPIILSDTTPLTNEIIDFLTSIKEQRKPIVDSSFACNVFEEIEKIEAFINTQN